MNQEVVETNKATEEVGLTEEQVDPLDTPELNQAAYMFQNSIKEIKLRTRTLSKNGLVRVLNAFAEFPLADKYPNFKEQEQQLFNLLLAAAAAKNVMTSAFMGSYGKEIINEAEDGIVKEILAEQTKEESNGKVE